MIKLSIRSDQNNKTAGKLDYPKKLTQKIVAWALPYVHNNKRAVKDFDIELDDWKYYPQYQKVIDNLQAGGLFKTINVVVRHEARGTSFLFGGPTDLQLIISIDDARPFLVRDKNADWLYSLVAHEMTHLSQTILRVIINSDLGAGKLPLSGVGLPSYYDPKTFKMYKTKSIHNDEKTFEEQHTKSDVEFFPILTHNIELARAVLNKITNTSGREKKAKELMNDVLQEYKNLEPVKLHKFLREFYRGIEDLVTNNMLISKRAKVVSDKPSYLEKKKTDKGYVWVYGPKHIERRWKEKKEKLERLEKNIEDLRKQYEKDLSDEDLRIRAEATIVGVLDDTAMRVGNEESVKEHGTFGATTLQVRHLTFSGNKTRFRFVGKDQVKQDVETNNPKITKVLKELVKGKKDKDFVFEIDGVKIWDRAINRYLKQFDISAKDLRGFQANRIMKDVLKDKDWKDALEETAETVGHEPATLKNQYLDPALVEKYEEKKAELVVPLSKRAISKELYDVLISIRQKYNLPIPQEYKVSPLKSIGPVQEQIGLDPMSAVLPGVKLNDELMNLWNNLFPHMPKGTKLTSGVRTKQDQIRVINELWNNKLPNQYKIPNASIQDKVRILNQNGFVVSSPYTRNPASHLYGLSVDLSGANLNEIAKAVKKVSDDPNVPVNVKFQVEPQNNSIHITLASKDILPISKRAEEEIKIDITPEEQKIFDLLLEVNDYYKLGSTIRVVGGWTRDKVLDKLEK